VPTDAASLSVRLSIQWREKHVLNLLGIEMDVAAVIPSESLDKLRNDTLSSVLSVKKRRNDDESHLTASGCQPLSWISLDSLFVERELGQTE